MAIETLTKLYRLADMAETIDCHPATLQRAIREGKLEAVKIGNGYRVSREAVWAWLQSETSDQSKAEEENEAIG